MPLIVVPTPVGNLEDITLRAIRVLREADWIACEDTRRTLRLLNHLGIRAPLVSSHEHNEREKAPFLLKALREGKRVALVTDAGTPGISDPGAFLVNEAIREGIEVEVLPGATAFVPALVLSGLPIQTFQFAGFLPPRKGDRQRRLLALKDVPCTLVFYVSPHRLSDEVDDCARVLGNRPCALVRELSKVHEEVLRMNLDDLRERVRTPMKGEMVLVVAGASQDPEKTEDCPSESWEKLVDAAVEEGLSGKDVVKMVYERYGIPKNRVKAYLIENATKQGESPLSGQGSAKRRIKG